MKTAADKVFSEMVSDILTGNLRPRDRVSERDLVARYGVSRTPVREAIKRMLERGFLEIGPKGIAQVLDLTMEDLEKLYELRLKLESEAAEAIVANIDDETIAELKRINRQFASAVKRRDLEEMLEVRARFHATLMGAMNNRWLADVLIELREKSYVVRYTHWQSVERARETVQVHEKMIGALRARDVPRYRDLVVGQIRSGLDFYQSQLLPRRRQPLPAHVQGAR
jgi:DNA-binding GntR family transcriptional regulator